MITATTASCISVIHDICSCKSHHHMITTKTAPCISVHMSYITEIQGAVVVVIIWWYDLQLHMSYITEIQGAGCKSHHHMITTTTASCISVIYDICSCKSHHHMITTTTASCISVIYSYGGVIYNYICHILLKYKGLSWS
jgi:hypothetical protein